VPASFIVANTFSFASIFLFGFKVIILFLFDIAKITTKLAEILMKGDRIFLWRDRGKLSI
jgi:hypothetical protein